MTTEPPTIGDDNMYKDALIIMRNLSALMTEARRINGIPLREIATKTGLAESSLSRLERVPTYGITLPSVIKIVEWLATAHEH